MTVLTKNSVNLVQSVPDKSELADHEAVDYFKAAEATVVESRKKILNQKSISAKICRTKELVPSATPLCDRLRALARLNKLREQAIDAPQIDPVEVSTIIQEIDNVEAMLRRGLVDYLAGLSTLQGIVADLLPADTGKRLRREASYSEGSRKGGRQTGQAKSKEGNTTRATARKIYVNGGANASIMAERLGISQQYARKLIREIKAENSRT